jgi:hypothetical protein
VISTEDVQLSLRQKDSQLSLTPLAASLLATLVNAVIYETEKGPPFFERHNRGVYFVFEEMPTVLDVLFEKSDRSAKGAADGPITALEIIHWVNPRWPEILRESPSLNFVFNKE